MEPWKAEDETLQGYAAQLKAHRTENGRVGQIDRRQRKKKRVFHEHRLKSLCHFGACGLAWLALGSGNERNYTY